MGKKSIQMPLFEKYAYRVTHTQYAASCDEFGNSYGRGSVGINVHKYLIIKETPQGIWILTNQFFRTSYQDYVITPCYDEEFIEKKFVLLTARKKFANLTLEGAYEDYIARKERQLRILNRQKETICDGISLAKKELVRLGKSNV